jgi:hypothetical protein
MPDDKWKKPEEPKVPEFPVPVHPREYCKCEKLITINYTQYGQVCGVCGKLIKDLGEK